MKTLRANTLMIIEAIKTLMMSMMGQLGHPALVLKSNPRRIPFNPMFLIYTIPPTSKKRNI